MQTLLGFIVDATGRKVEGSVTDALNNASERILRDFSDLWAVDLALWQLIDDKNFEGAAGRASASNVLPVVKAAIESGDMIAFVDALRRVDDEEIKLAALGLREKPSSEHQYRYPGGYLNLHGVRPKVPHPTFGGDKPWLRAFTRVRTTSILHERGSALLFLLNSAAQDDSIKVLGESVPIRSQLEAELAVILESWFDPAGGKMLEALEGFLHDWVPGREQGAISVWVQRLCEALFPRRVTEAWLEAQPVAQRDRVMYGLDKMLAMAAFRNAKGSSPLRPLPMRLVSELQRIAGGDLPESTEGKGFDADELARWTLAASGTGWLSRLPEGDKRVETVRWMLAKIRSAPRDNLAFAQSLVREQSALDESCLDAVQEEVEFLADHNLDANIDVLLVLLPIVVTRSSHYFSSDVVQTILSHAEQSSTMKESLRTFEEVTARTGQWKHWDLGMEALIQLTRNAAKVDVRRVAAKLALEAVAEARRSPFVSEGVATKCQSALDVLQDLVGRLGRDVELERELWRARRQRQ